MSKNTFGKKLQQIRRVKNLTQSELAEKAGINEKHISKIETGVYFPTYNTLSKILKALDIDIKDMGLEFNTQNDNPFYIKSLQILNNVEDEKEFEYYYGILNQAKKGLELITKDNLGKRDE